MSSIVLINAYETSYLGTRILASYLLAKGFATHNIILCSGEYVPQAFPLEKHEGYQSYSRTKLVVNKATHYKVSEADLSLLEKVLRAEAPDVIGFSARSTNNWLIPVLMPVFRRAAPQALVMGGGLRSRPSLLTAHTPHRRTLTESARIRQMTSSRMRLGSPAARTSPLSLIPASRGSNSICGMEFPTTLATM